MKSISIFGSTGSIGVSCLDVIRNIPKHEYKVLSLVANSNYKLLAVQAIEFGVKLVVIRDEKYYKPLKELLSGKGIHVRCGDSGILEACSLKSDLVVGAIVGIAGLMPTYNAIIQGSDVLLANKESLVCGGDLIKKAVKKHNVRIVPVDSEHNAIFQVFDAAQKDSIHKITLTASGGPFRGKSKEEISKVSVKEALNHPTWKMGKKVTIDSATMFNKGLEVIEAYYLFDVSINDINVVVHPQSIIHGMVEYKDGSILAQMSNPDMKIPILNALYYPTRYSGGKVNRYLDFHEVKKLTFEEVDNDVFPSLEYAREAVTKGTAAQVLLNAANEVLVEHFLRERIRFCDIFDVVGYALSQEVIYKQELFDIRSVISFDKYCREVVESYIGKKKLI